MEWVALPSPRNLPNPGIEPALACVFFITESSGKPGVKGSTLYFYLYHSACFPHSSVGKESTCNAGDPSPIPESGRFYYF